MGIVFQLDKRSGITYAYESISVWDKEKKQSRSKRKLLGRVDPETKEIIPTDGRCKKLSPYNTEKTADRPIEEIVADLKNRVEVLEKANATLKYTLEALVKEVEALKDKK